MGKRPKTQQHGAMLCKVVKAVEATAEATTARGAPSGRHVKRRKTSAASFFADSDDSSEDDGDVIVDAANPEDELKAYLNVPQIKYVTEQDMMNWWKDHQGEFPNVAVIKWPGSIWVAPHHPLQCCGEAVLSSGHRIFCQA